MDKPNKKAIKVRFDPGSGYACKGLIFNEISSPYFINKPPASVQRQKNKFFLSDSLPYKPARYIVPSDPNQRSYIVFYVFDAQLGKMVRKRDYEVNSIPDGQRLKWAKKRCNDINKALASGHHIDRVKQQREEYQEAVNKGVSVSLEAAFDIMLDSRRKLRAKTQKNYRDYLVKFKSFIYEYYSPASPIKVVDEHLVKKFFQELEERVNARTFNNYRQHIYTLWKFLMDEGIVATNPFQKIKPLRTTTGRNIAYNKEQVGHLMKYMQEHAPNLKLFCEFMYYTLARPNEICQLRISDIDRYRQSHIYISSEISKNGQERHVVLVPELYKKIVELKKLPKEWFLFGIGVIPGPNQMNPRYISDSYQRRVLTPLKFNKDYTLYSWKHTGVVFNYLAGLSPASLRMQIGHSDTGSFEKYLKSLGLFENREVMENYIII